MSKSRDERRFLSRKKHKERLKHDSQDYGGMSSWAHNDKKLGKISRETPKRCSCHMCGNPRDQGI